MSLRAAIVCGLKSEAAAVRAALAASGFSHADVEIGVSGADAGRAEDIAERFVEAGARALLSVGVSGGLDPALAPGALIIATRVVTAAAPGGRGPEDDPRIAFDGIALRPVYGSDVIIQSPEEKARLFSDSGACAVDMESHAVAHVAMAHGLSFLAVRAIADPAPRALPAAALGAVAPDGSTRVGKTLLAMTKAPGDIPALLQLGSDSQKALKTLRRDFGGLLRDFLLALDL